jgi:hypothetical protein
VDLYERKVIVIAVLCSQALGFYFGTGGPWCGCVSFLVGQRNNTKLLVFLNVLYNKAHMVDHHGTVHAQMADVVDGNQLWRIDWNLFNDEMQTPRK